MSIKEIAGSTVELVIKIVFLIFAASYIMRMATAAYDYGFRIFTEEPVSLGEGRIISVNVEEPVSAMEVGKMLEERGLIDSYAQAENGRERRYYRLTTAGRRALEDKEAQWAAYVRAMGRILGGERL